MAGGVHRPHARGDIQRAFEGQTKLSMEELTADNKLKLLLKRQNRLVC